jgi:endonuclease YncB( thermonuclease family)
MTESLVNLFSSKYDFSLHHAMVFHSIYEPFLSSLKRVLPLAFHYISYNHQKTRFCNFSNTIIFEIHLTERMVSVVSIKRVSIIACLFLLTSLASIYPHHNSTASEFTAQIERVVDGDTITLRNKVLGTKKVRLVSIDAPETNYNGHSQFPWGQQAKEKLMKLLPPGTTVTIQLDQEEKDSYGRLLAYIIKENNININKALLQEGFAVTYYIYPNLKYFKEFQSAYVSAKENGKGIWNSNNPLTELPFEFRLRVSNKKPSKYVGDYEKKEYVEPSKYKQIPVENRVFFDTKSDAASGGYKQRG